jgi:hypothetical protein
MELARLNESVGDNMHPVVRALLQNGGAGKTYFYKEGDECSAVTGGWSQGYSAGTGTKTYTEEAADLKLYAADAMIDGATNNAIDLTDFTTLFIDWETTTGQNATGHEQLLIKPTRLGAFDQVNYIDKVGVFARQVSSVNVSAQNGLYYIAVRAQGANAASDISSFKVYNMWGE